MKVEDSRCSFWSRDRSTLPNFLQLFQTWTLAHDAENNIITSESIRVVGKERVEFDKAHGREKIN